MSDNAVVEDICVRPSYKEALPMKSSGINQNKLESIVGEFLLNSKHFGCLVIDQDGIVLLANNNLFSIFPSINEELIGRHLSTAIHPQEKDRVKDSIEYLFEHGELSQSEWELLTLTEKYVHVDIEASVFESNGLKYAIGIFIDRTEKIALEADIEKQSRSIQDINDKYELAIKTAKLGIWNYDILSDELECNQEVLNMYGLTQDEWIANMEGWRKYVHKEDLESTNSELAKAYAGQTVYNVRFRIVTNKGDTRYISASAAPGFNEAGDVVKIHGVNIDITDLITTELEANQREHQLKNITNNFPGIVLQYIRAENEPDSITYISDGVKKVFGIEPQDAIADPNVIWEQFDEEVLESIENSINKSSGSLKDWHEEFVLTAKDGSKRYLRGYATPQKRSDHKIVWDTTILDITEQKNKDKAIYESQQMLERLTNQVPGMVYIFQILPDGTQRFEFLNKGVELLFGIEKAKAMENIDLVWDLVHPEDVVDLIKSVNESAENLTPWNALYRILTKDGEIKHVQGSGTPTKLSDGTIQWYSIAIDITKQLSQRVKLVESRRHLNVISDNFPGVIYTYVQHPDGTDNITYISKGIETLHGISVDDALSDISLSWDLIHPEDVNGFIASVTESAKTISSWEHQFRSRVKDGTYRYFQGYGKPTKLENGSILWTSISFDVHEQVESRNEARRQKELLESITDQINGLVIKYQVLPDGEDRITYISKRVKEYWGVEAEDVKNDINVGWARIVPEDIEPTRSSIINSVKKLTQWDQLIRFVSETGEIKYMQAVGNPKKLDNGIVEFDIVLIDITEVHLALKDAEEKQRQLEIIGDQIPGVVFTYYRKQDGTDGFSYFSDGFEALHGFEKADALANPKLIWDQVIPEDLPAFIDKLLYSATNLAKFDAQYRIKLPNGDIKYIHGFGSPTMNEEGTIIWNAVNLDITDRKRVELEIQEKQRQLQSITNQIPGVVLRYQIFPDGSDKILYVSDGVEELYGISQNEAYSNTSIIWERIIPEDVENLQHSIQRSAQSLTKWEHVFRYNRLDDTIGYLQGFGTPSMQDDGSIIWDSIIMDSTQRMMAELEAVRSSEKMRSLINASPLAIYQINSDGIVTDFWNPAAENVFGWLRKEVIGAKLPHVNEEVEDEFAAILASIKKERQSKRFLVHRRNKFNEELALEITAGPFFNDRGELTDLLIIANDVTELQEYRKTLEAALKEKDILLQEIHHRVKNNLAIVSGLLELQAMRDDSDSDHSMIIEARNRIHSIAMVHEQLYQDMDFSHINPSEYYRKLLQKLQANTISDPRDVEYDLIFDIDKININRAVPLGLLINELFTNSIKYAFKDGTGKLTLHFKQVGDQITILYEDNGPGFVINDIRSKNTIGWQLIETLLAQLDSEYTMDTEGRFRLEFVFTEALQGSQGHFN